MPFPKSFPLSGSDYFHVFLDKHLRKYSNTGNIGRLRIDVQGNVTIKHFHRKDKLLKIIGSLKYLKQRLFSSPKWVLDETKMIHIYEHFNATSIPEEVFARDIDIKKAPLVHIDLIYPSEGKTIILLSWHHALMDARGAELFIKSIGENKEEVNISAINSFKNKALMERLLISKEAKKTIVSATPEKIYKVLDKPTQNPTFNYSTLEFTAEETQKITAKSRELGLRFGLSPFYLAASSRSLYQISKQSRNPNGDFWVPIPQDQRLKGADGPILSNQVSFLFYKLTQDNLNDLKETIEAITNQMVGQIRDGTTKKYSEFMDLFKVLPLPIYSYFANGPSKGNLATFFFSDTGDSLRDFNTFFDFPVTDAWHFPPNIYPPGFTIIFTRFKEKIKVVVGYTDRFSAEDIERFKELLKEDLLN